MHAQVRVEDDPPFHTTRHAVTFAVTRAGAPLRPLMNRMADGAPGGSGLSRLDAAAQAGMILGAIGGLGDLARSLLIAGAAPKTLPCDCRRWCCSGRGINEDWRDAIESITSAAERLGVFSLANSGGGAVRIGRAARSAIVIKIYSRSPITFTDISRKTDVSADALARHHRVVLGWLMGRPGWRVGETRDEGADPLAWRAADELLRDRGIVG